MFAHMEQRGTALQIPLFPNVNFNRLKQKTNSKCIFSKIQHCYNLVHVYFLPLHDIEIIQKSVLITKGLFNASMDKSVSKGKYKSLIFTYFFINILILD